MELYVFRSFRKNTMNQIAAFAATVDLVWLLEETDYEESRIGVYVMLFKHFKLQ